MRNFSVLTRMALLAGVAAPFHAAAFAQDAQPIEGADEEATIEEITVTGYRASLNAALDVKRNSVGAVDAIVAEDIAKFPDQNLAESLQRITGVVIQRDGGEGRAITVRGLGSQFTRVRVNGMETVATTFDGASPNRDRAFDFNVFASELFSSIVVHKTSEASLDEGSLGAVVDLNTGNPLAGKEGFTVVASGQAAFNDLADTWGPRFAGLVSWRNAEGSFGASLSAAWQKSKTLEVGNNTVRWSQARFDSVDGTACWTQPNAGGSYIASTACNQAALAFHPRIPRYGEVRHERERLGITGSVQWSPTEATKVSVDALFSRFDAVRSESWGEVLFRSNERSIDVVNPTYDGNGNMISGTFNDAWVRTESYRRESRTDFWQVGGSWEQKVTDRFRFTLQGGISKSNADIPVETTIVFDDRDSQGYKYDYSDMNNPVLSFGTSVTDPANFQLAEIRDRPSNVTNRFRTAQLRTEWEVTDDFTLKTGVVWRKFSFDTVAYTRDTVVCPNAGGRDLVLGTITCTPVGNIGPTAVYGFQVTPGMADLFELRNSGAPSGTTTSWLVPNLESTTAFTKLYDRALVLDAGNNRSVTEEVKGGYFQFDFKGNVLGLDFAGNVGTRYVHTKQWSAGLSSGTYVEVERSYDDWLPAANLAFYPAESVIIRLAAAEVMTRPSLGTLTPGGSIDGFNYRVTFGNPYLEPYRATSYDASVEWYFAPQSLFSVAFFAKQVSSFPIALTREGTFASTGLPTSIIPPSSPAAQDPERQLWTITSQTNGAGANLKGVEISLQGPFTFLPGFLSRFGGIANASFIGSDADYTANGPAITPGGGNPQTAITTTLFGLSKRSYNGTLYYEDSRFSARGSISYRSGFVDGLSATGNVLEGYDSTINVDASIRYKLTESLELSIEGVNLTDERRVRWVDQEAERNYENNRFGRTILFGARFKL